MRTLTAIALATAMLFTVAGASSAATTTTHKHHKKHHAAQKSTKSAAKGENKPAAPASK